MTEDFFSYSLNDPPTKPTKVPLETDSTPFVGFVGSSHKDIPKNYSWLERLKNRDKKNEPAANTPTDTHPTPPVPDNYRWQGDGPLHTLDTDADDTRIRCAYCQHFAPRTQHGRLTPWCAHFDEYRDPGILHHCERFELEACGAVERWRHDDRPPGVWR